MLPASSGISYLQYSEAGLGDTVRGSNSLRRAERGNCPVSMGKLSAQRKQERRSFRGEKVHLADRQRLNPLGSREVGTGVSRSWFGGDENWGEAQFSTVSR